MTSLCPKCHTWGVILGTDGLLAHVAGVPCGWVATIPASAATIDIAALRIENERFMAENRLRPRQVGEHLVDSGLYTVTCIFCGKTSEQKVDQTGKLPHFCANGKFTTPGSCRYQHKRKMQIVHKQYGSWEKRKGK